MERRFPSFPRLAILSFFLPTLFLLPAGPARAADEPAAAAQAEDNVVDDLAIDLKNDAAVSVSVPLGADNGVTRDSDFLVIVSDDLAVSIYPQDLYDNRFWSQPLADDVYERIRAGMLVLREEAMDPEEHDAVRVAGEARLAEMRAKLEEARRQVVRQKLKDLRDQKEFLMEQRDDVDDRLAAIEEDLSGEEGRMEWATESYEADIDRALVRIADLADQRDELLGQRNALAKREPYPGDEIGKLTAEIKGLNSHIASERENIRNARDRKRSARSAYLARKQEWQTFLARRNALNIEILSIDRKVKELSAR